VLVEMSRLLTYIDVNSLRECNVIVCANATEGGYLPVMSDIVQTNFEISFILCSIGGDVIHILRSVIWRAKAATAAK
jgi:hypothetical protein